MMFPAVLKGAFYGALASICLIASSVQSWAEDVVITPQAVTPTRLIDTANLQTNLLSSLQPWIVTGLVVGISMMIVLIGWRLLRRFAK